MMWLELIICAGLIIWTASTLSRYADILSEKTGLSRGWVGVILLAGVTSLPELASGTYAVAWLKAPNLAAGAIMGSCLFNIFLIALWIYIISHVAFFPASRMRTSYPEDWAS